MAFDHLVPSLRVNIGHNVINISKVNLSVHQTKTLEKGLTFCPTPKGAEKSEIWNDFKEFHRCLELAQFFKPTIEVIDNQLTQSIIDFMNENAEIDTPTPADNDPYKHIHRPFRNKSSWKPDPPNRTLDTFKGVFKNDLLMSSNYKQTYPNLFKPEYCHLKGR